MFRVVCAIRTLSASLSVAVRCFTMTDTRKDDIRKDDMETDQKVLWSKVKAEITKPVLYSKDTQQIKDDTGGRVFCPGP